MSIREHVEVAFLCFVGWCIMAVMIPLVAVASFVVMAYKLPCTIYDEVSRRKDGH